MYNEYENNYEKASATYTKCMNDPNFSQCIEQCDQKSTVSLRCENLLVTPIQRIPRYNLLLSDLFAKTSPSHPDYANLRCALDKMEEVTQYLDKDIKMAENHQKFLQLSAKGAKKLLAPHRKLLSNVVCQRDYAGDRHLGRRYSYCGPGSGS